MSDLLFVTDRTLAGEHFLAQVEAVAKAGPRGILLREKDLSPEAYQALAAQVLAVCQKHQVPCILHSFPQAARALGVSALHLPLPGLRAMGGAEKRAFRTIGASCHSVEEALEAQALGASYLTAGHIFETTCKAGLPGRGLDFLSAVCAAVDLPVYAIGGITPETMPAVRRAGAAGACLRSALMTSPDPRALLAQFSG